MSPPAPGRNLDVQRAIMCVGIATAALFLAVVALTIIGWITLNREVARNGLARQALCAQRSDLDQRLRGTRVVLAHYRGRLVFGIPRKLILSGLRRDQATRRNLSILDCKETR